MCVDFITKRRIIESNYQDFSWHRFQDDLPTISAILHKMFNELQSLDDELYAVVLLPAT
jgi:hypothetical protein